MITFAIVMNNHTSLTNKPPDLIDSRFEGLCSKEYLQEAVKVCANLKVLPFTLQHDLGF